MPDQNRRAGSWRGALVTWVAAVAGMSAAVTVVHLRRVSSEPSSQGGPEQQLGDVLVGMAVVWAVVVIAWYRWRRFPQLPAVLAFVFGFLVLLAALVALSR